MVPGTQIAAALVPRGRLLGPTGGLLIGLSPGRWVAGSIVAGYALARGLAAAGQ